MAYLVEDDIRCCVDCLCYLANGDLPYTFDNDRWPPTLRKPRAGRADKLNRRFERRVAARQGDGVLVIACQQDEHTGEFLSCEEFTWRGCDVCGSPLGGEKHRAAILR